MTVPNATSAQSRTLLVAISQKTITELNACSQRQWKEASEGAEQNLAHQYLNIFLSCVLLL